MIFSDSTRNEVVRNQELKRPRKERLLLNKMKRTRNRRTLSPPRVSPSQSYFKMMPGCISTFNCVIG